MFLRCPARTRRVLRCPPEGLRRRSPAHHDVRAGLHGLRADDELCDATPQGREREAALGRVRVRHHRRRRRRGAGLDPAASPVREHRVGSALRATLRRRARQRRDQAQPRRRDRPRLHPRPGRGEEPRPAHVRARGRQRPAPARLAHLPVAPDPWMQLIGDTADPDWSVEHTRVQSRRKRKRAFHEAHYSAKQRAPTAA